MSATPQLCIGLPVYNGAEFLAGSIEALLGQTYEDFELIISDNVSTDGTAEICRSYETQDSRIRYFRQPQNIGSAANHNFVVDQAKGELFKWASHDDLYARELLERCVDALDERPDVVLAHSWTAMIDSSCTVTVALEYPVATTSRRAPERLRSMLFANGGDDIYGVMRLRPLRPALHLGSYHFAWRPMMAGLSLYGPFYQVPEWLYFRREHPELRLSQPAHQAGRGSQERDWPIGRGAVVKLDPRRTNRLRHPLVRLYGEYVLAYITAIRRAPLTPADRRECYYHVAQWAARRAHLGRSRQPEPPVRSAQVALSLDAAVAGQEKRDS